LSDKNVPRDTPAIWAAKLVLSLPLLYWQNTLLLLKYAYTNNLNLQNFILIVDPNAGRSRWVLTQSIGTRIIRLIESSTQSVGTSVIHLIS